MSTRTNEILSFSFLQRTRNHKKSIKMFKQHLEMIGRNETPTKKAKFWQSYVRSLKGIYIIHSMHLAVFRFFEVDHRYTLTNYPKIDQFALFTKQKSIDCRFGWYPCSWFTKIELMATIERWFATIAKHLRWTKHTIRKSYWSWLPLPARSSWNIRLLATTNLFASLCQTQ